MENEQYMQAFLDESVENIQVLNTICLKMDQGDMVDDDFATMFRAAHTLKGMCGTMGFTLMMQLTHKMEDALGHLRAHPAELNSDIVDSFFAAIDALEAALASIQSQGSEPDEDHSELIAKLSAVGTAGQAKATAAASSKSSKKATNEKTKKTEKTEKTEDPAGEGLFFEIDDSLQKIFFQCAEEGIPTGELLVRVDPACMMKGPRAILVSRSIEQYADILRCYPDVEDIEAGSFDQVIRFLLAIRNGDEETIVRAASNVSEIVEVKFVPIQSSEAAATLVENKTEPQAAQTQAAEASAGTSAAPAKVKNGAASAKQTEKANLLDRTIRVPVEKLDVLMNLLSELIIDKTRLSALATHNARNDLREVANHISRVANDLQTSVMGLRMVPVESLFQRFPRMIRDLSKSLGKEIHLEMSGLETEFDRTVIDEMGEALVHLIRNAADHGLESTEERLKVGKPAEGVVSLRAYASGQHVFIEVADDGGGVHRAKVRQRAVEKGVVSPTQAAVMTDSQVVELLFDSGFSTADKVSDVSGRGVGLDAVKRKVESLGGTITVDSQEGAGSTFRIQLPLTLSILQALLVQVNEEMFAIPLGSVEEIVAAKKEDLRSVQGQTMLNYRQSLVPILDAGIWLHGQAALADGTWHLVVCREGTKRVAVGVSRLFGQQEIVNKSLGIYLKNVRLFSGATILGDGSIALIMDVHFLMSR